ncbi:MAG: hypothetical protein IJP62_01105 [Treponema sp.]|nr:hypothetical protein [Treponema sp.]
MLDALNLKWGWGVAFRPTDKIILAARSQENYLIYGGIGCDLKFGVCWVY